jgi:trehalose 6-phosphate synthase/phosphatase
MLQADVIGFQTYSFARHFLQTCARILSVDATPSGIQLDTHYCSVGIYPIGIDISSLSKKIADPDVTQWVTKLREKYAGKKLIVARDKLDYIKGVRQKLLAFEQFLIRHPEWRGKVVLIQIALSTAEHNELRAHISDVVSRVNSKFSNISYQPIVFLHQDISFAQYLALLTCADACLLTPLRDGMNLTSHEYIVCQKGTYNPLILSEVNIIIKSIKPSFSVFCFVCIYAAFFFFFFFFCSLQVLMEALEPPSESILGIIG